MAKKRIKLSEQILGVWFVVGGLIFLFAPQSMTSRLQLGFASVFSRQLKMGRDMALTAAQSQSLPDGVVSRDEYDKLINHLANITESLNTEREKVEKLSGLSDRVFMKGMDFVLADVIKVSVDAVCGELIINRGKADGLVEGYYVMGNNSIIGIISQAGTRTSRVRLLTDPKSKVAINISQSDIGAILQGKGNNSAGIELLSKKHRISVGDFVYARKNPGFLDASIIAGRISSCETNDSNPLFWDVTVVSACDIENLADVAVIVANKTISN